MYFVNIKSRKKGESYCLMDDVPSMMTIGCLTYLPLPKAQVTQSFELLCAQGNGYDANLYNSRLVERDIYHNQKGISAQDLGIVGAYNTFAAKSATMV